MSSSIVVFLNRIHRYTYAVNSLIRPTGPSGTLCPSILGSMLPTMTELCGSLQSGEKQAIDVATMETGQ